MRACRAARTAILLAIASLVGCSRATVPVIAGALPDGLDGFLAAHPLAPGQDLRADELTRTPSASWHVVQVVTTEQPHRHLRHDLTVFVLRGEGVLTLDGRRIPLRAGDAALVPRNRVHWFTRGGRWPAVALVVFTPALDAPDVVPEPNPGRRGGPPSDG